jgi:hypothetical protein
MLRHALAAMTLDKYADLFDSDLDTVAESVAKCGHSKVTDTRVRAPPPSSAYGPRGHIDVAFPPVLSVRGCKC